ncbi:DUF333 domain-containing protein (plasmid) [Pantoea alfalfae]|uniref:putative hemolysin n=1 Tax=Pantoea alfalfae TaxID=3074822 RepID=UPI001CA40D00|nr:DUF333 domain-containing protein [Pantoea alfalfae]QZX98055.1 DUF333 domain-containing protein [Pantoea alfalfae]
MKVIILIASTALLAACSTKNDKPQQLGMANPASVYCEKIGGKLDIGWNGHGQSGFP